MVRIIVTSVLMASAAAMSAHVAISAAAAYAMSSYERRIFDVRQFPDPEDFSALVGGYLAQKIEHQGTVVAGSSFSFGYPMAAELTFPYAMAGEVVNASVVGASFDLIMQMAPCQMLARKLRAKILIVEVPLINEVNNIAKGSTGPLTCVTTNDPSLLNYAWLHPFGAQWFDLLKDPYADSRDRKLSIQKVFDGYFIRRDQFEKAKDNLKSRMQSIYDLSNQVADQVYLFVTPVYVPGVKEAGDDPEKVREQFDFAEEACIEIAGPRCIETTSMLEQSDYFANITHLNGVGADYLGDSIARTIASQ